MKIVIISILVLLFIALGLFLFSVLKVSSYCSRIEELNDTNDIVEGDDDYV